MKRDTSVTPHQAESREWTTTASDPLAPGGADPLGGLGLVLGSGGSLVSEQVEPLERQSQVREHASAAGADSDVVIDPAGSAGFELAVHVVRHELVHLAAPAGVAAQLATKASHLLCRTPCGRGGFALRRVCLRIDIVAE